MLHGHGGVMMSVAWCRIFKLVEWMLVLVFLSFPIWRIIGWVESREPLPEVVPFSISVPEPIQPGTSFDSEALQSNGGENVVLFTRTTCPFSSDDVRFYRKVGDWAKKAPSSQFVVVSDESPDVVRRWLGAHAIPASRVVSSPAGSDLYSLGVIATPTVATMNESDMVTGVLVGALTPSEEDSFLAMLSSGRGSPMNNFLDPPVLSNETFENLTIDDENEVVLDVRERTEYGIHHDPRAVSIPNDELSIRAPVELGPVGRVYVDCRVGHSGDCRQAARWLVLDGFHDVVAVVP